MDLVKLLLIFTAAIIGISIPIIMKKETNTTKYLLIFSAGLLLSITILELFPSIYTYHTPSSDEHEHNLVGIWILVGVGIQILLEGLSKGLEHGHMHASKNNNLVPLSVIIGIFIHSFLEAIPSVGSHDNFIWALSVHKITESIVISTFILSLTVSNTYKIAILALFALSAPMGMMTSSLFNENVFNIMKGIVAGIFLHISSVIIFEMDKNHTINWKKMGAILLGILLGLTITSLHHH